MAVRTAIWHVKSDTHGLLMQWRSIVFESKKETDAAS
jgi:hypothetical protein